MILIISRYFIWKLSFNYKKGYKKICLPPRYIQENFGFIPLIRLPDFVIKEDFDWAIYEATRL